MNATVILVGVRGFGAIHRENIRRLEALGRVRLVARVDPLLAAIGDDRGDSPLFASLSEAFAAVGVPRVVVAAVPIAAHASVAEEALRAGADVLLEKPPFARLDDFERLLAVERETGHCVQIGFQSLGSLALDALDDDAFGIGRVLHVRAMGAWVRRRSYWQRSPWAGHRFLDGVDVVDGVATNALAHAVATALRIAGVSSASDIERVDVDAYRTNPIDCDDTTAVRIVARGDAPSVMAALTLSASEPSASVPSSPGLVASTDLEEPPVVEVVGETGTVRLRYTLDEIALPDGGTRSFGRVDLLENLLDHCEQGAPLAVPLGATGAFMRVLDAVRTADEPTRIEERFVASVGEGADSHPVLDDVEQWIRRAADVDGTFVDAGAPWASSGRDAVAAIGGTGEGGPLLSLLDGSGSVPDSSPRPYLHPVRTLAGVELTARRPADHDWHLGLGFTIADVDGTNLWGGGTYTCEHGYELRDDHGRQRLDDVVVTGDRSAGTQTATVTWLDRLGNELGSERREMRWRTLGGAAWRLDARSEFAAARELSFGSPATNGRAGAGYGGWFWRFPVCADVEVRTAQASGEDEVHGSTAPWLLWSARFLGHPGATGEGTILLDQGGHDQNDPWFVRATGYQAVGTSVAACERLAVAPGAPLVRNLRAVIADGRHTAESLLTALPMQSE